MNTIEDHSEQYNDVIVGKNSVEIVLISSIATQNLRHVV